jgi:hypothetical protein
MCQATRRTKKSCLCYKVLAAGRLTDSAAQIDQAFQFVLENIKPQDAMIIGMYPRYMDQVADKALVQFWLRPKVGEVPTGYL